MPTEITTSTPAPGVLLVTVANPGKRNAVDLAGFRALAATWRAFEDGDARVAVVTGAGGDFSSGADLASVSDDVGGASGDDAMADIRLAVLRDARLSKPVIAAVEGVCYGAGFEMTGGCDLRVAGESARFAAPEVRHGLIASGGTIARLARQIPYATAMQLLLTGQPLAAPRLLELGFLNEIVPDGSAVDRAVELARVVAANSPVAVTTTKKVVSEGTRVTLAEAYALEAKAERDTVRGPDAVEGAKAFLEKRRPSWVLD